MIATVEALLREAEGIRERYNVSRDVEDRERLKARYREIDAEIGKLKRPEPPVVAAPDPKPRKGRKGLALDPSEGAAAELLSLCQSVVRDGLLSNDEVGQLRAWLDAHRACAQPAVGFLRGLVEHVLADGAITEAERTELHKALEKVLPPELRALAAFSRKLAARAARDRAKAQKRAEQDRLKVEKAAERERKRRLMHLDFMVAGVGYEGRGRIVEQYVEEDDTVFLVRDRENRYSRNAVEVRTAHGFCIGYVPEGEAGYLAPLLDAGGLHEAYVKRILDAGRVPIPVVVANVYGAGTDVPNLVAERQVPVRSRPC